MSFADLKIKNDFIESIIESRLSSDRERIEINASDHNGVEYMVYSPKGDKNVTINVKVPYYSKFVEKCQTEMFLSKIYGKAYKKATIEGYDLSLVIDTEEYDKSKDQALSERYSLIGRYVSAAPYLWAFQTSLAKKSSTPLILDSGSDEAVYILPLVDRVIVCFGLYFNDEDDRTISKVFLTELSNCKNSQSYSSALQLYYGTTPPKELGSSVKKPKQDIDISYVTFVFLPLSYSTEKKIETCADRMFMFRTYLRYHIKASRVMMHTRMRNRASSFLKILNRAKQETSATSHKAAATRN